MVDWLVVWGVTQAFGFAFKAVLAELATDAAKDYVTDFFKDCLSQVVHLPDRPLKTAYGQAIKEFLDLVQGALEDEDYSDAQIKAFNPPLKQFIRQPEVAAALGQVFDPAYAKLDTGTLAQTWQALELLDLPAAFDWERIGKRYVRKVRAIVENSDELRPIFDLQLQAQIADATREVAGVAPDFDLVKYAEGLREQYGRLRLDSLDTTGAYYSEMRLWKMFVPQSVRTCPEFLPQVYELPKEHLRQLRERGELDAAELAAVELEKSRRVYIDQPIRPVLDVLGDPQAPGTGAEGAKYAVILGDPGSGKSTLLQYFALTWAQRPARELAAYPLPLMVELRVYGRDKRLGNCKDILTFLHQGNVTCRLNQQDLHQKLKAGQAIALFDGLDEVFDPTLREEVQRDIHRFTNDYPAVRCFVTSRWLGYKAQQLRDAAFEHLMLQDLAAEQVEQFIERWHGLTFKPSQERERDIIQTRLQKAVEDRKPIQELAGNPLLLTMMAILNRSQPLPRNRALLYERCSEVLLHKWDVEHKILTEPKLQAFKLEIDYQDKQEMLRRVAYHLQSTPSSLAGNVISRSDLERILATYLRKFSQESAISIARIMIEQLRGRNFILCDLGANSYAFIHRTFLEYFCAKEFSERFNQRGLEQGMTIEELENVFRKHWQDKSWHEVLRLITGMVERDFALELVNELMTQDGEAHQFENLFLAVDCVSEIRDRDPDDTRIQSLKAEIQALVRDNKIDYFLQENRSINKVIENIKIMQMALTKFSEVWRNDPDTLNWLKARAQTDENSFVRQAAVQELARVWKEDPETLTILKTRAQSDDNYAVRQAAVQELARVWKEDPETLTILKTR
ncbi:MAG: NACHT domain-containing protein, partial [Cyanobacteria bacterium P01_G01_bin.54]